MRFMRFLNIVALVVGVCLIVACVTTFWRSESFAAGQSSITVGQLTLEVVDLNENPINGAVCLGDSFKFRATTGCSNSVSITITGHGPSTGIQDPLVAIGDDDNPAVGVVKATVPGFEQIIATATDSTGDIAVLRVTVIDVQIAGIRNHLGNEILNPGIVRTGKEVQYLGSVNPNLIGSGMDVQWQFSLANQNNFGTFATEISPRITPAVAGIFDVRLRVELDGKVCFTPLRRVIVVSALFQVFDKDSARLNTGDAVCIGDTVQYVGAVTPGSSDLRTQWQFASHGTPEDSPNWQNFSRNDFPVVKVIENVAGDFDVRLQVLIDSQRPPANSDPFNLAVFSPQIVSVQRHDGTQIVSPGTLCHGRVATYTGRITPNLPAATVEWQFSEANQNNFRSFGANLIQTIIPTVPGHFDVRLSVNYKNLSQCYSEIFKVTVVRVTITNTSRGGDRVVSAQDAGRGLPGGRKELTVSVEPSDTSVDLRFVRIAGASGSGVFQSTNSSTRTLTGTEAVLILGRDISSDSRNMALQACLGNTVCTQYEITVFRVDPTGYVAGPMTARLPASAMNANGVSMQALYLANSRGNDVLGHFMINDLISFGGIVIEGLVVPSGIAPGDFNRTHDRGTAFNWDRRISGRQYDGANCLEGFSPTTTATDDRSDDLQDGDEDLRADPDFGGGNLYIWVIDLPNVIRAEAPADGDILRVRKNFIETAQYAGVQVSSPVNWYWRSSQNNPAGLPMLRQLGDVAGDNVVGLGVTALTPNLGPSTLPGFTVTRTTPPIAGRRPFSIRGVVIGTRLDSGGACQPLVYLIRETFEPNAAGRITQGRRSVVPLENQIVRAVAIRGDYNFTADHDNGEYQCKVFIGDGAQTSPNATTLRDR